MSDERRYNQRGGPSSLHKVRKIVSGNKSGDVFGITIPQHIAKNFFGCFMSVSQSGGCIILESGCKVINQQDTENILKGFLSEKYKKENRYENNFLAIR
jgi:hypothetical protein